MSHQYIQAYWISMVSPEDIVRARIVTLVTLIGTLIIFGIP